MLHVLQAEVGCAWVRTTPTILESFLCNTYSSSVPNSDSFLFPYNKRQLFTMLQYSISSLPSVNSTGTFVWLLTLESTTLMCTNKVIRIPRLIPMHQILPLDHNHLQYKCTWDTSNICKQGMVAVMQQNNQQLQVWKLHVQEATMNFCALYGCLLLSSEETVRNCLLASYNICYIW